MRILRARLLAAAQEEADAEAARRPAQPGPHRRPLRADPHLQLPGEPDLRPPHRLQGLQPRPGARRRPRRRHRGPAEADLTARLADGDPARPLTWGVTNRHCPLVATAPWPSPSEPRQVPMPLPDIVVRACIQITPPTGIRARCSVRSVLTNSSSPGLATDEIPLAESATATSRSSGLGSSPSTRPTRSLVHTVAGPADSNEPSTQYHSMASRYPASQPCGRAIGSGSAGHSGAAVHSGDRDGRAVGRLVGTAAARAMPAAS